MNIDFDLKMFFVAVMLGTVVVLSIASIVRLMMIRRGRIVPFTPQNRWLAILWAWKLLLLNTILVLGAVYIFASSLNSLPHIQRSYPAEEGYWQDPNRPIEIVFNVPIEIDSLQQKFSRQEIQGTWKVDKYLGFLPLTRHISFTPNITMPPEERLVIYVTGMDRLGVVEYHEQGLAFFTHKLAEVFSTSPVNGAGDVAADVPIVFMLDQGNTEFADWQAEIEPPVDFDLIKEGNSFKVDPRQSLQQGQQYKVRLKRTAVVYQRDTNERTAYDNPETVAEITFTTVKSPLIESFSPSGRAVKVDESLQIVFEQDMQRESVESNIRTSPEFEYTVEWTNDRTLIIKPSQPLAKETAYTITLLQGIMTQVGGVTEKDVPINFTTIGAVKVLAISPANGSVRVARNSSIQIDFDQEVDHASAEGSFTSNMGGGSFSWSGNSLIFTPAAPMAFSTSYSAGVYAGVIGLFGDPSREPFSTTFTTVPNQTVISGFGPGSWDHQDYTFSCGVAALKMALAWKGAYVDEYTLIYSIMGNDNTSKTWNGSNWEWGDPNRNYLGNPEGSGDVNNQSAYGVHWIPVMNALAYYGFNSRLERGWNVYGLAQEINSGHPVQIFWWNGVSNYYGTEGGVPLSWIDRQTGQPVEAIHGMHSILIVGFNGDVTAPTSFIALDPWFGYVTYTVDQFNYQWPKLGNTGVVIY